MRFPTGWPILFYVLGLLLISCGYFYSLMGFSEDFLRVSIRTTATTSLILFLLAFSASSLYRFVNVGLTRWQIQNRRYIGLSFACSHFLHLIFIVLLIQYFPERLISNLQTSAVIIAMTGYIFLIFMTLTSFSKPRAFIGEQAWHWLHTAGMYVLWLVFFLTYASIRDKSDMYVGIMGLLISVLFLRTASSIKKKLAKQN